MDEDKKSRFETAITVFLAAVLTLGIASILTNDGVEGALAYFVVIVFGPLFIIWLALRSRAKVHKSGKSSSALTKRIIFTTLILGSLTFLTYYLVIIFLDW